MADATVLKTDQSGTKSHPRYPGLRSFGVDPRDHDVFFGRDREARDLVEHIKANRLTVLYGKSGLGKTSLLQAGVFPGLRERGLLPLRIRLNLPDRLPIVALREEIEVEFQRERELASTVDMTLKLGVGSWWEFFKTALFWQGRNLATPCLVLDQFEEVFTLHNLEQRTAIAEELSHLVNGTVPPDMLDEMRRGTVRMSDDPPDLRIVLSLRTEYVGQLQELFPRIPGILNRRVVVHPLDAARARDAIEKPAALRDKRFAGAPFRYDAAALDKLVAYLEDADTGTVEPYHLQLQCQEIERRVEAMQAVDGGEVVVTEELLNSEQGLGDVVRRFYLRAMGSLAGQARDRALRGGHSQWFARLRARRIRMAARNACEFGLLSDAGHRWQLSEGQILRDYSPLSREDLDFLVEQRLLRRESRLGSFAYELAHDSLKEPVYRLRPTRLTKSARRWVASAATGILVLVIALALFTSYSQQQARLANEIAQSAKLRAEAEEQRAEAERQRAEAEKQRAEKLTLEEQIATRTNEAYSEAAKSQLQALRAENDELRSQLEALGQQVDPAKTLPIPEMIDLEGGDFTMGCLEVECSNPDELPTRSVTIAPFGIGRWEVTFEQYDPFALETGRPLPDDEGWGRGSRPVINVSWEDATAYAAWLSEKTGKTYRLPTESEWEFAARSGTTSRFWWGEDIREGGKVWANCVGCGSKWDNDQTAPGGSFAANQFGLQDTAGNVWEWVEDCWHENYEGAPADDSAWLEAGGGDCGRRVLRGGSWYNHPDGLRSAFRARRNRDDWTINIVFRLAQDSP